jgi:hypothetical protein
LEWHRNDPVDAWEENRNNIIYYSYQNNRNPFIDFPKLAEHIWGTEMGVNWTGEEVLGITTFKELSLSIYPNPASNIINVKGLEKSVKVEIYDTLGRKILESQIDADNNAIDVSELRGMYLVNIVSQEKIITKFIAIK